MKLMMMEDNGLNKRADQKKNKKVIFKNCLTFIEFTSEINNTQIGRAQCLDIVIPMNNLIEYNDTLEIDSSGSLEMNQLW